MVIDVLWPRPDPRYAGDRVGVVAHAGADPFLRVAADYTKNAAARCDLVDDGAAIFAEEASRRQL